MTMNMDESLSFRIRINLSDCEEKTMDWNYIRYNLYFNPDEKKWMGLDLFFIELDVE